MVLTVMHYIKFYVIYVISMHSFLMVRTVNYGAKYKCLDLKREFNYR